MKRLHKISPLLLISVLFVFSSCQEEDLMSEAPMPGTQSNEAIADALEPELFSDVVYLDSVATEAHEMPIPHARTSTGGFAPNKHYEVWAYLKAHRIEDHKRWWRSAKDEVYLKAVELAIPSNNRYRRGIRDYKYLGREEWDFRNGQSRTIGPLFRTARYFFNGIGLHDGATMTYVILDEKDQWKSAIYKTVGAVVAKAVNVLTKGVLSSFIKPIVKELLKEGIKNMYESIDENGDDIIGSVQVSIGKSGSKSLALDGEALQFARKVRSGTGFVEYRLSGSGADYTLRLYMKEVQVTSRPPRLPNPKPVPPCNNCLPF